MAEDKRKQIALRLSTSLYNDLSQWAEDDFRSLNGQIEFLLHQAVQKHKGEQRHKDEDRDVEEML